MTNIRTIEIYVPLMTPVMRKHSGSLDELVQELSLLSERVFVLHKGAKLSPIKIEKVSKTNKELRKEIKTRDLRNYYKFLLKFSTSYKLDGPESTPIYWAFKHYSITAVQHLIICLNILKPGAFDTRDGVIISTQTYWREKNIIMKERFPMLCNSLDLALDLVEEYHWPTIKVLKAERVISLLEENWSAFEVTPKNRLQRALNAFSYLFHDNLFNNAHIDLFYSLIGIEALYVDSKDNVQKQVDIKSQLLLGERTVFKKKFNELYDFRSRYIHGQLNFTNKYNVLDHNNEAGVHRDNNYSHASLAMMILLASIQRHLEHGKSEIEFEYKIKEN